MSDLAELLEDPAVARAVLGALVRDTTVQIRRNGAAMPPWLGDVARALAAVVDAGDFPAGSVIGTSVGSLVGMTTNGMVSVREAADLTGKSESYIRRLARTSRVRSSRAGARVLLVDSDSLLSILGRAS